MGVIEVEQKELVKEISKSYQNSEEIFHCLNSLLSTKDLSDNDYTILRAFKHLSYRWREFDYTLLSILMNSSNVVLKKIYEIEKVLEFLFLDPDNKAIEKKINSLVAVLEESELVNVGKKDNKEVDKSFYYNVIEHIMLNSFNHKNYQFDWANIEEEKIESLDDFINYVNCKSYANDLNDKLNKIFNKQFYVDDNGNLTYTEKELSVIKELLITYNSILKDFIFYLFEKYHIPNSMLVTQISDLMFEITDMHHASM